MTQTIQADKNPSAEGATARVSRTGATPSLSTDTLTGWPLLGTKSHKLVATGTAIATTGLPNADRPAAAPGDVWSARVPICNGAAGSRSISVSIVFYNSSGGTLGTALATASTTATVAAGTTHTFDVTTAAAPVGTASVDLQISRNAGGGAATSDPVYADTITLTKTATPIAYRDPASDLFATWSGTADASTQVYWDPSFTLTPVPGNLPCPCITVALDDMPPGVATLTLYRTATNRTIRVRGGVEVTTAGSFSTQDLEAPFQVVSSYRAEMFDSSGVSLGFTQTGSATLTVTECWVHNPLDPSGATTIDISDTSAREIVRPVRGKKYQPEGRTLGVLITSRRGGVEGVELEFSTTDSGVASAFEAMVGGYDDDTQQVPVLCIRATPFMDLPSPFFAAVVAPRLHPINVHMGSTSPLREWVATVDEVEPPFPGIIVPLLRRKDIDYAYPTRAARAAAYASRALRDRDYSLSGIAP